MAKRVCFKCKEPIEAKTHRKQKCEKCIQRDYRKRNRENPVKWLYKKFYENSRNNKRYNAEWVNKATVKAVYERCEGKCAVTGEDDYTLLCVNSLKEKPDSVDDLVLMKSTEAINLSRKRAKV